MTSEIETLLSSIASKERELDAMKRRLASLRGPVRRLRGISTVLACRVQDYRVALPTSEVDEVVRMPELTVLPESPEWLSGLLRIGTEQIPVIDLAAREAGVRSAPDPEHFIVVTQARGARLGFVMHAVDALAEIDAESVQAPSTEHPFGAYVIGVCSVASNTLILISAAPLAVADFLAPAVHE